MKHESPIAQTNLELNKIFNMDCLAGLRQMEDQSVHTCVTSPPYWGLRDYGVDGQHGLEESPELFVSQQVEIFREVRRVIRDDGTLWLNIGDSYAASGRGGGGGSFQHNAIGTRVSGCNNRRKPVAGYKVKDLVGVPWMLAFALRADGWYLRDCIIWSKPNPMPESVTDRTTKAHEYIFLLSKSQKYYYDSKSIREPAAESSIKRWQQNISDQAGSARVPGKTNGMMKAIGGPKVDKQRGHSRRHAGFNERWDHMSTAEQMSYGANKRSVWTIPTKPFKEAHFATFPEEIPRTCILAGCPPNGVVLDPYMGAGTTALVARKLQRNYVGFELNPDYVAIAERRLKKELGLFY